MFSASFDETDLFYNPVVREMTKFCVVYETWTKTANLLHFGLELNATVAYEAVARFQNHCRTQQIEKIANFACKLQIHYLLGVVLGVVVVVA